MKMKVILTAFDNKLRSEPMEFPDETPPDIHLMMDIDHLSYSMKDCEMVTDNVLPKRAKFTMTTYSQEYEPNKFARIYKLVEIF